MNTLSLTSYWIQLLVILAVEVLVVAAVLVLLLSRPVGAAWRRTFCQAGLAAVLLLVGCEFSGASHNLAAWLGSKRARGPAEPSGALRAEARGAERPSGQQPAIPFRSEVESRMDRSRWSAAGTVAPIEALGARAGATDPPQPAAESGNSRPADMPSGKSSGSEAVTSGPGGFRDFWLGLAWVIGTALVAVRACVARCLLAWFGFRRRPVAEEALNGSVRELAQRLGIWRRVRVVESARLAGPIAFGWLRPTIGLPPNFTREADGARREAMLAHELAHLAAHDPFWCAVADAVTAVLWWHPGAWWMRRQLRLTSELAADEASLLVAEGPRLLAESLLELGNRLAPTRFPGQLSMAGFRSHLGCRVQRLVHLEGASWSPPRPVRTGLVQSLGPMTLAAVLVLCSAWAMPRDLTKGETMKTMQLTWKRSLTVLGLAAAVNAPQAQPQSGLPAPAAPSPTPPSASAPARPALTSPPAAAEEAFRRRYGLAPQAPGPVGEAPALPGYGEAAPRGARLEAKLKTIVLPEVRFEGMPLSEVLANLSDQCRKLDRDKTGVNFLINPNSTPVPVTGAPIDPTTGLPMAVRPEPPDMGSVQINFNLPLRNVTMKEVLDAMVKVADHPIDYTVEDYAVVFSPRPDAALTLPLAGRSLPAPEPLAVTTFKMDTNTFVGGLESAFGIKVDLRAERESLGRSRLIQTALKQLLTQLGVEGQGEKSVFYNELTGILMVRGTREDVEVVRAAMETLGGTQISSSVGAGSVGFGGLPVLSTQTK